MAKSIQNQKNCCQYIILTLEDTKCSIQSDLYVWKADGQNRDHFLHTGSNAVHLCWEFYCRVRASQHYKAEMVLEFLSLGYFFLVSKTLSSVVSDFYVSQYFLLFLSYFTKVLLSVFCDFSMSWILVHFCSLNHILRSYCSFLINYDLFFTLLIFMWFWPYLAPLEKWYTLTRF